MPRAALGPEGRYHRRSIMSENRPASGNLGIILGVVIAIAAGVFLLSGGENFGKKTVNSDADLPPVTTGRR